ncbi:MAG: flagellar basal-body MS-ring/collar protein FliF [Methylococcaceae bacterium]
MSEEDSANLAEVDSSSNALKKLTEETETPPILKGLSNLSIARQVGLLLGIALSVSIGIAVVLWSQEDSYDLLYAGMGADDSADIIQIIDELGIDYKVETESGALMVPADEVRKLKLKLAAEGLPRSQSSSAGYELLDKEAGFGTSRNVELMRFRRALEGEIAKTISTIQNIKSARVLLALPKQSVFVRKRKKPSASVIVNLYQGRRLEKEQVEAIVHLVASSVPMMDSTQVTVVDQKGRMLSRNNSSEDMYLSSKQFEYKKNIEEHLMRRIENILIPLVGRDGMQAQISADVDFAVTEKTQEMFNPDLPALRSEQTQDEQNSTSAIQGVPGALSNQPPPAGVAPEIAIGEEGQSKNSPSSSSQSATRNYELDKTITHTRLASGVLRRLSVAVVIDYKKVMLGDGESGTQPYAQEDVNQFRQLVMQAVGFDNSRGDQVTVTNVAFRAPDEIEVLPELPLWEQEWFVDLAKQVAAVLVVLFLILGVIRPTMRGLVARDEEVKALLDAHAEADAMGGIVRMDENGNPVAVPVDEDGENADMTGLPEDVLLLEAPQSYEKRLEYIQKLIDEDSLQVSQILTEWLKADG